MSSDALRWQKLLAWLRNLGMKTDPDHLRVECRNRPGAGRGLFALSKLSPSTLIFAMPSNAMINVQTLLPQYRSHLAGCDLSAVQLISLHLLLNRPGPNQESLDTLFGPYVSVLPHEFGDHPLAWIVKVKYLEHSENSRELLQILPPSTMAALLKLEKRFHGDWQAVCECMRRNPEISAKSRTNSLVQDKNMIMDFLWAWLSVNTRCIYYPVKLSKNDPDNLTLCPILDFANHTPDLPPVSPISTDTKARGAVQNTKYILAHSPENCTVEEGQEFYLNYGTHSNRTLFTEYGFVNGEKSYTINGEVEIQDLMEDLFDSKGIAGSQMKQLLEEEGYWGDWTLHVSPESAYPSFRVIAALRLLHLDVQFTDNMASNAEVERWKATILGQQDVISNSNEQSWRSVLLDMCHALVERASNYKELVAKPDQAWVYGNIRQLWDEEAFVASAVAQSILNGEEF